MMTLFRVAWREIEQNIIKHLELFLPAAPQDYRSLRDFTNCVKTYVQKINWAKRFVSHRHRCISAQNRRIMSLTRIGLETVRKHALDVLNETSGLDDPIPVDFLLLVGVIFREKLNSITIVRSS